jgi:hypothetical protein
MLRSIVFWSFVNQRARLMICGREKSVPIVKEEWITDCIKKKESLPLEAYDLSKNMPGESDIPWDKRPPSEEAAESLMAEVKSVHCCTILLQVRYR